jgi:hypothetical protein
LLPDNNSDNMVSMASQTLLSEKQKKKRGPAPTGVGTLLGVRLQDAALSRLDDWIAAQPEPRPTRPEAIRRLLGEAFGNQEPAAQETDAVALELSAPTSKSVEHLRAAILAFADEIANDPDNPWYPDGYETRVRQLASSPDTTQQSLVDFVDNEFHKMNKLKAADRRRKK